MTKALARAANFCADHGLRLPILLAPMAGACPVALSTALANAGGMGACGALLMPPAEIAEWAADFYARSHGALQINLWVPDPPALRDAGNESRLRAFLSQYGPAVPPAAANAAPPDFAAQFAAVLAAKSAVFSTIMGILTAKQADALRLRGIKWFATITTVAEARAAAAAGADALIVQGAEAGGHRGVFDPAQALQSAIGLFALLPAIADAVQVPLIAAGGIADARTIAAALMLGASAVQIGTGFLRSDEAGIAPAWAAALARAQPEDTMLTRAFSGRYGRSLANEYAKAAGAAGAPPPAPYPVQRGLTQAMRAAALRQNNINHMQAWAGQAARLAPTGPAGHSATRWWEEAQCLLRVS